MRAYIAVTGILFLVLVAAHVMRLFPEPHLARNPWFLLTTFISLAMAAWSVVAFRAARPSRDTSA